MGNFDDLIPKNGKINAVTTPSKNLPSKTGAFDDLIPSIRKTDWMDKASSFLHETEALPRSFVNSASFGGLDAADSVGEFLNKKIGLPYQKYQGPVTIPGKVSEAIGSLAGSFEGPGKLAAMTGRRIFPKLVKEAGVAGKLARTAQMSSMGAVGGFTAPGSLEQRTKSGVTGAILGPTLNTVAEAMKPASVRIAQGIIKPKGRYFRRSEKIAENALKEGVLRSGVKETQEASQNKINSLMEKIDQQANASTSMGNYDPMIRRIHATAKKWIVEGETQRAKDIITKADEILSAKGIYPGKKGTAKEINLFRKNQDAIINELYPNAYFRTSHPSDLETRIEIAGAARRELGRINPEMAENNRRISNLIDIAKSSGDRSGVSARNNLFDIVDYGLAANSNNNPIAQALLLTKKGWQGGKALAARGMYKTSEIAKKIRENLLNQENQNVFGNRFNGYSKGLGNNNSMPLLESQRGPISTSIPKPEFEKSLPIPIPETTRSFPIRNYKAIEKSPIIFGESNSAEKLSLLKKMGIDPFTGKMKYGKPKTALDIALDRFKKR